MDEVLQDSEQQWVVPFITSALQNSEFKKPLVVNKPRKVTSIVFHKLSHLLSSLQAKV